MRKYRFILIILSLFCVLMLTNAKSLVYHEVGSYELNDFPVFNQCTGDWIVVSGVVHYNIELINDGGEGNHWKYHANHNLTGSDQEGNKYQVISNVRQHYNSKDVEFPYEWSFVNTSPLISQGKVQNMFFKIRNQITINANGEITVSFSESWIECKGPDD
ncbi:MAG: hypothetical protein Kow00103_13730 [Candidatus Caldatribacteriota bacterium]